MGWLWLFLIKNANPTRTRIRWHLQWHPLLDLQTSDPHTHQKITRPTTPCVTTGLGSANPDPYTHQTTPPTTACVTAPPRNESTKPANPHPQLEVRTPITIAKAIWGKKLRNGRNRIEKWKWTTRLEKSPVFAVCKILSFITAAPSSAQSHTENLASITSWNLWPFMVWSLHWCFCSPTHSSSEHRSNLDHFFFQEPWG